MLLVCHRCKCRSEQDLKQVEENNWFYWGRGYNKKDTWLCPKCHAKKS